MLDTSQLTLAEKASLTAGVDLWHTAAVERLGVPSIRMTDGPNGARGDRWSGSTSACLPCGAALGATWNRDLVRQVGRVLAEEAHSKGAQVLLAPTVNIHRHPLNGRHFESYSEDPFLTAEMAVAYITGVQERGVAAVVKHFVCNDQEHERHTISVAVDERALREIYLPPFEAAVQRARVWGIMSAYNRLAGTYCSEHRELLTDLLRNEWGFDGLVVSDWGGTHSSEAVDAGLDIEMPGPAKHLGAHLPDKVTSGAVQEASIDRAADRLLTLISRTSSSPDGAAGKLDAAQVAREAAREAIVLLRNDGVLPLQASSLKKIALIGPMATRAAAHGGGSAEVTPPYVVSPLEALRERLGQSVEIVHEPGAALPGPLPLLDAGLMGGGTLDVAFYDNPDFRGEPVAHEGYAQSRMTFLEHPVPGVQPGKFSARVTATLVPTLSGPWRIGLSSAGQARVLVDGKLAVDNFAPEPGSSFWGRGSKEVTAEVPLERGRPYPLLVEYRTDDPEFPYGVRIGVEPVLASDSIQRAARAAADADVVLIAAGYDGRWESEGFDRPHMDLPGEQDALIRAVAAANPRTIVALNAGSPVTMDWADDVAALLQVWFPGMEVGRALVDVLVGDVDASGRLPTTFPRRLEDSPTSANYPGTDGVVRYAEGIFVGYRGYDRNAVEPRFSFGHGLSYTTFTFSDLRVSASADGATATFTITNSGARAGDAVPQLYVHPVASDVEQPEQQLKEFAKVQLRPGEARTVRFDLPRRAFAYWDLQAHAWKVQAGEYEIRIGASARDIRASARVNI